ncbi:hypothetical protein QFZ66_000803 [Streptomyces sp. B4I13]|nr:hypothetical protein [Streptomyces sp. B4I13]
MYRARTQPGESSTSVVGYVAEASMPSSGPPARTRTRPSGRRSSGGWEPGQVTKTAPYARVSVAAGSAARAKGYGRTTAMRGYRRAISSSPPTHTSRRSRTASATGIGALSPTRSQGAAKDRGSPAITAISRTVPSPGRRYTAPECAPTASIIEVSARESSGRPPGAHTVAGAWPEVCSGTPTTSSPGVARMSGSKSAPCRRDAHGERPRREPPSRTPRSRLHAPSAEARDGVRPPHVRPRAP